MSKSHLIFVVVIAMAGSARAEDARLSDAELQQLKEGGAVVTKVFVAMLRKKYTDESAAELRKFIDPRYLKEHKLQEGKFPIRTVVTGDIYTNVATDDPQTLVVIAGTESAAREVFVFRVTVYEQHVYLRPLTAPDPTTKAFSPWMLRQKVMER